MEEKCSELTQVLERDSTAMSEAKDCAVRAVAVVGDLSYGYTHGRFAVAGREPRMGVTRNQVQRVLKFLSIKTKPSNFHNQI